MRQGEALIPSQGGKGVRTPRGLSARLIAFALAAFAVPSAPVLACACCTETAARLMKTAPLDGSRLAELEELRFAPTTYLDAGAATDALEELSGPYALRLTRSPGRWVFALKDARGRSGSFVLELPTSLSLFEVDPRTRDAEGGLGPILYKEWTLRAPARGEGALAKLPDGSRLTLILHGRGRGCTEASHFEAWTLQVEENDARLLVLHGRLLKRR